MENIKKSIESALVCSFVLFAGVGCTLNPFGDSGVIEIENSWTTDQLSLECGSSSTDKECDGSVGVLVWIKDGIAGKKYMSRCTGWVHQGDVVTANMHCVDSYIAGHVDVPVKETYFKMVDRNGKKGKVYKISKLIKGYRSGGGGQFSRSIDYAYFRTEEVIEGVRKIPITRAAPRNGQELRSVSVNNRYRSYFGREDRTSFSLDTYKCEVSNANAFARFTGDKDASAFGLYNCPIVGGNSGSPLLTENGEAIGLIDRGLLSVSDGVKKIVKELFGDLFESYNTYYLDRFGVGNSFHCIPDMTPESGYKIVEGCQPEGGSLGSLRVEDKNKMMKRIIYDEVAKAVSDGKGVYSSLKKDQLERWDIRLDEGSSGSWGRSSKTLYRVELNSRCARGSKDLSGQMIVANVELHIDSQLRLIADFKGFKKSERSRYSCR